MSADVTRDTPVATFKVYINNPNELVRACIEAVEWLDNPDFEGERMGLCMDTFVAESVDHTLPHQGWAVWNLRFWRQYCDEEIRAGFISVIWAPMTAYKLLREGVNDAAGDDWSETERETLRAVFRGQLPNVPDAETI